MCDKGLADLPVPMLAELRAKKLHVPEQGNDGLLIDLRGGLENSVTFADDPLAIQERLRNEWNQISPSGNHPDRN